LQELVGYYQNNSLRSVIPDIGTTCTLKYAYYEVVSPPKSKIELPWPISPETSPDANHRDEFRNEVSNSMK